MKPGMLNKLLGGFGVLTSLASLTMISAAVGDLISGSGDTAPGILIGLMIFFTGTAVASGYFAKKQLSGDGPSEKDTAHSHETMILELAMKQGGRLNIAQIAALTPLSVNEAKEAIKVLSTQGVAEVNFNGEGEIFYAFEGLENMGEHAALKSFKPSAQALSQTNQRSKNQPWESE